MVQKLKTVIAYSVSQNAKGYILLCLTFCTGSALALLVGTASMQETEIKLYMKDFFSAVSKSGIDNVQTFYLSFVSGVKGSLLLCLLAISILGVPMILAITLIKGYSFGVVLSVLLRAYGAKSMLVILCGILPHALLTAPCYIIYTYYCFQNAHSLKNGFRLRRNIFYPLCFCVVFLMITSVGCLVQAYLEPILLRLIAPYFL